MHAVSASSWNALSFLILSMNNTVFPFACHTVFLYSGKACVLKCLLNIHKVFRENDPAYILNDLYITDYCIWIQKVK